MRRDSGNPYHETNKLKSLTSSNKLCNVSTANPVINLPICDQISRFMFATERDFVDIQSAIHEKRLKE